MCGCQTIFILAQEVLSFTKVFFIHHQLNWWFYLACSATKKGHFFFAEEMS